MSWSSKNVSTLIGCSSTPSEDVERNNEATLRRLEKGDLVKFERKFFFHWGVYIGYEQVVHLIAKSKYAEGGCEICQCSHVSKDGLQDVRSLDKAAVCEDCGKPYSTQAKILIQHFSDVAGSSMAFKDNSYDTEYTPRPPGEIKKRAKSKVGPSNYNWCTLNCEHFATWCRYNVPWSSQSSRWWNKPSDFLFALKRDA